jgi:hypothetical protein
VLLSASACTAMLDGRAEQCRSHADCQRLDPAYVCASDGVCVALSAETRQLQDIAPEHPCSTDNDCASSVGLALCRNGDCVPIHNPAQGCFLSAGPGATLGAGEERALPIGILVPSQAAGSQRKTGLSTAVGLAITEINGAREQRGLLQLPPLVGIECDEERPDAVEYLLKKLQVRLVLGPSNPEQLRDTLSQRREPVLYMPPFPAEPDLAPEGAAGAAVLSCQPLHASVHPYLLEAITVAQRLVEASAAPTLGSVAPGLAVSEDVATTRFASGFNDAELAAVGVRRVPYVIELGGRGLVSALAAAEPPIQLVVAASAVDTWDINLGAVDGATFARTGSYPYYLLAEKQPRVLEAALRDDRTAPGFPRQYSRVLGLDAARDNQTKALQLEFESAYAASTQSAPEPGLEYAYDCVYVSLYAMVAAALRLQQGASSLTSSALLQGPDAVLLGLRALQGGGPVQPVGALHIPEVLATLAAGQGRDHSLELVGASSSLDFRFEPTAVASARYVGLAPSDGELYCIDAREQQYCDTGIIFPADGSEVRRPAGSVCACLGALP